MNFLKRPYFYLAIILLWSAANINWQGERTARRVLGSDAQGYYAYLPALFVYGDLSFGFADDIQTQYFTNDTEYEYRVPLESGVVNKYYAGTAIMIAPFYAIAHSINKLQNGQLDGYSAIYPAFVNVAGICFLLLGLWFFEKICNVWGISKRYTWLTGLLLLFGTNLFHYSIVEPGMSHVYSFALINGLIYQTIRWLNRLNACRLILMGGLIALIALVRPINVLIILFLPFFSSSEQPVKQFFSALFSNWKALFAAVFVSSLILIIQPLIYFVQTGAFWIYSYQEEGFNFLDPEVLNFLFSYKKGYFMYTPLAFVAFLLGGVYLFRSNRKQFYYWIIFWCFLIYILSSWWNWWYGGSFSSRVMIDFSGLLFLPFAAWLAHIAKPRQRLLVLVLGLMLTILCQVQILQYRYFIIHWDAMTKELYWDRFLQLPG